jgi:hypothetical protein
MTESEQRRVLELRIVAERFGSAALDEGVGVLQTAIASSRLGRSLSAPG